MSEENKNNDRDDELEDLLGDEDFSLEDLDFDDLDDDDDALLEKELEKHEESAEESVTMEGEDSTEESVDDLLDDMDMSDEEIPDDFGTETSDEEVPDDFGMGSLDDFSMDDSDGNVSGEMNEELDDETLAREMVDDNDYSNLDLGEGYPDGENPVAPVASSTRSRFVRIVVFSFILFIGLGFGSWYVYTNWFSGGDRNDLVDKPAPPPRAPSNDAGQSTVERSTPDAVKKPRPSGRQRQPTPTVSASTSPGTITRLDKRTGQSHIIIGSFVDEDLANDYANKLASDGKSPSIILPFNRDRYYYRIAIASYSTIASAQQNLDGFRANYGQDAWLLRY